MTSEKNQNNVEIKKWAIESEADLLDTPIFKIKKRRCQPPDDGGDSDFFIIDTSDWVNIIAKTDDDQLILVRQYRFGIDEISLEIPGGVVDPADKNPLAAAKRELMEETGYVSHDWRLLGKVSTNPAIFTNYCYMYLAENCIPKYDQNLDPHERIEVKKMGIPEVIEHLKKGSIHHSLVVAAFAQYLLQEGAE